MNLMQHIRFSFQENIKLKIKASEMLIPIIVEASQVLVNCIQNGGKILSCGNGGSACDAMHFNAEIANRYIVERNGLSAITLVSDTALLTAISNDYSYQDIFSRQIKALGNKNDVLLSISTSGNSENIIKAILKAHECKIRVIALTGNNGGKIAKILTTDDVEIRVPSSVTPRIQESHILVIHCLCELVDILLKTA
ncbi:MAG: SIS domain-containing protein [Coxiellaceae bacterium]|jgi:phosphoheptose isomerase|nr:SIS domain-containing protein [Coxiellaceae bacterium]